MQDQDVCATLDSLAVDANIEHVTCHSWEVRPGWAFVALKGEHSDGVSFLSEALKSGATAILCDRDLMHSVNVPFARLCDGRNTMALLARKLYGSPDLQLATIGVTGTNGKTTTTTIMRQLMLFAGYGCGLIGGVVNASGDREQTSIATTPDSPVFYRLLKQSVDAGDRAVAVEVSSHGLALARVYGAYFRVGLFTNLTQDHLDFHFDMESYFKTKLKLFLQCQIGLINIDDPFGRRILAKGNFMTYGFNPMADYHASNVTLSATDTAFDLTTPRGRWKVRSPLLGRFNIYNLLAALAALTESGFDIDRLLKVVPNITGAMGRMDRVDCGQPFGILVDYAHTSDAIEKLLIEGRRMLSDGGGRLHVLFGCGGDRDSSKRPLMARAVADGADIIWHTSDNTRWEDPGSIIDDAAKGIPLEIRRNSTRYHRILDRAVAVAAAISDCRSGDLLLLVGKGHEPYQDIMGTKYAYSDRKTAEDILLAMSPDVWTKKVTK
jgi:UDP-N-acetylmuramoyl-L-alanyl-D-glutamate--2,6-diaminopimelate ligase